MRKTETNLMLAGVAFIAASVSKIPELEYGLYLLSMAFVFQVALSELRMGMIWLAGRVDAVTDKLEKVSKADTDNQ